MLKTGGRTDVKAVIDALDLHREDPEIRRLIEEFAAERYVISQQRQGKPGQTENPSK